MDNSCMKGGAFYKDPGTKMLLIGDEPREIQCSLTNDNKFIWPQVKFSDGTIGKIVYSLWTAEEKSIYKKYRAGGKEVKVIEKTKKVQVEENKVTHSHVLDYEHSVPTKQLLDYIKKCTIYLGELNFDGIPHDLLKIKDTNYYTPIARVLIPLNDRIRLGIERG